MLTLEGNVTKLWSNCQKIGHHRRPFQIPKRRSPIAIMIEESRPCRPEQNLSVDRESMPLIRRGRKGHGLGSLLGRAQERIGHERHHTLGLTGQAQHRHCSMECKMQPVTRPQQKIGHHRRLFRSPDRQSPIAIMTKLQVQDLWHR